MNRLFSIVVALAVGVTLAQTYRNMHRLWSATKSEHQPLVRRPGYPIVKKAIDNTKKITVLISSEGFGGTYRGTGVLIDATHVLTCFHMVRTAQDDLWIFPYPGKRVVKAHPIQGDKGHDLAILELEEPIKLAHYAVFNTTVTTGQPITVVGNTEGSMRWFVTYGVISSEEDGYYLTDAVIHGGNSGGPWVNDQGEVVAISDFGIQNGHGCDLGINGGVKAGDIVAFINAWRHPVNIFEILFGSAPTKGK